VIFGGEKWMSPDQILRADPLTYAHDRIFDADALCNSGNELAALKKPDEAIAAFRQAIALRPDFVEAHFALGIVLVNQRRYGEAIDAYRSVIGLRPDAPEPHFNIAIALTASGHPRDAVASYRHAIALRPDFSEAYLNLGVLLRELGEAEEAIALSRRALAVRPDFPAMQFNLGVTLAAQGRRPEAITAYREAIALKPDFPEPYCGLGLALVAEMRLEEAVAAYRQAVALRPDFFEAYQNLGVALRDLGRAEEAIEACRAAIALRPDDLAALVNLGTLLREQWYLEEALAVHRRAVELDPGAITAGAQLAMLRRAVCDWSEFDADRARVLARSDEVEPFILFTTESTPAQQLASARRWAAKFASGVPFTHSAARSPGRIRIGYLSADFHRHATAYLMAELVERHDRQRFETFGYSYGADDGSEMRARLARGFEHFVDLRASSHDEAARRIHADGIDILVDLKGYTGNTRTEILVNRPALVQVNYLGFPGTMGAPFIDYIIADPFVAPLDQQAHFSEKIVHLPDCYQPNDTKRPIAVAAPTRAECGLPEHDTVFCSFNGAYKITPAVFDVWMRLLRRVPGSVLWLLSTNTLTEGNLRHAASARGVDAGRLVFCPPLHLPQHLARHRNADLFLDTLPVNAHTTASDALWAGLPFVTCAGETFISRVAGSLLHAAGLPELVTRSLAEYEARAFELVNDPRKLAAIKEKLACQRLASRLFDIERFTRNIELAYRRMHELWAAGEAPQSFAVAAFAPKGGSNPARA
jgi:protein O-GlcNAc transferase